MAIRSLQVLLEPELEVYLPGQSVSGSVKLDIGSSSICCRAVDISCTGKAKVQLMKHDDEDNSDYKTKEVYFKFSKPVWRPHSQADKTEFEGYHIWPFCFELPHNIPSSFEGPLGFVRYKVKAKLDRLYARDDKAYCYFFVNCPYDLNYHHEAKVPLTFMKEDTSCCCCWIKGPVRLNFDCERSGAVVGENFLIRGEVCNEGSDLAKNSEVILYQLVQYCTKLRKRTSCNEVCRVQRGAIAPGDSDFYENVPLKIKTVVPGLRHCSIIDLQYELEFRVNFDVCRSVSKKMAFYIGTVPIMDGAMASMLQQLPALMAPSPSVYTGPSPPYTASPLLDFSPQPSLPMVAVSEHETEALELRRKGGPAIFSPRANDENGPTPPPGFISIDVLPPGGQFLPPLSPGGFYPGSSVSPCAPLLAPGNPFPNQYPLIVDECWFCLRGQERLDNIAPPPKYISYDGLL